jgi:hypothetical protein
VKLCAIIRLPHAGAVTRVPKMRPTTYVIHAAELRAARLHEDGDTSSHGVLPVGDMRVCVPLTMVQESLDLGA